MRIAFKELVNILSLEEILIQEEYLKIEEKILVKLIVKFLMKDLLLILRKQLAHQMLLQIF